MSKLFMFVLIAAVLVLSALIVPAESCYGPHITTDISPTQINVNETVTITGLICPPGPNATVRIAFVRPGYTYFDAYVLTDNKTGEFSVTQQLDTAGFWNIIPINGHICDRLFATVIDPSGNKVNVTVNPASLSPYKIKPYVIGIAVVTLTLGAVVMAVGTRNKTRKISSLRLFVQIAFVFILFGGIFVDHQLLPQPVGIIPIHEILATPGAVGVLPDGIPLPVFGCYYPCGRTSTCALWEIQAYIFPFWNAGHGWAADYAVSGAVRLAIVFGILILFSVLLGRFFCGWICPFGLYVDVVTRIRKVFGIKHRLVSDGFNEKLHQLRFVILALLIIVSVIFGMQAIAGTQLVEGTQRGGFVYQYFSAPFCQVCPMKPLCVMLQSSVDIIKPEWIFGVTTGQFYQLGFYVTSLNLIVLGIVTAAAFFFRRSWCRICPLGGLIALFNRYPPFKWVSGVRLNKVEEKCTKCGVCKRVCPTQVTEVYEKKGGDVTTSKCLLCLRCVEMCPYEGCLQFKVAGKTVCKSRNWLNNPK